MRRIAISCRVDRIPGRDERRDALDQRWHAVLAECGLAPLLVPNIGERASEIVDGVCGIILSGGNDIAPFGSSEAWAPERDATERALLTWARDASVPVLGVCRGMQMINVHLGGQLSPIEGHVRVRHALQGTQGEWPGEVNSYHDLGIFGRDLAPELLVNATVGDGSIEAVSHRDLPWVGIMWHPEREQAFNTVDRALIKRLFSR